MNRSKTEWYFMLKPVLLGYDKNYCTYKDFSIKITAYYILFFALIKYDIEWEIVY